MGGKQPERNIDLKMHGKIEPCNIWTSCGRQFHNDGPRETGFTFVFKLTDFAITCALTHACSCTHIMIYTSGAHMCIIIQT